MKKIKSRLNRTFLFTGIAILQGCTGVGSLSSVEVDSKNHIGENKETISHYKDTKYPVKSMSFEQGMEVWTYDKGKDWCGILLVIPIALPVCNTSESYYFSNGVVTKHSVTKVVFDGWVCSIFPMDFEGSSKLCGRIKET